MARSGGHRGGVERNETLTCFPRKLIVDRLSRCPPSRCCSRSITESRSFALEPPTVSRERSAVSIACHAAQERRFPRPGWFEMMPECGKDVDAARRLDRPDALPSDRFSDVNVDDSGDPRATNVDVDRLNGAR
jgi:hypothetical protein